ncbi:VOC family protein [uncultured Flavobacterium sp.]|uniref:bleomycin resistance protein n=1 Tax=uncultured Flavobacterium sp. TaxID=165435 RepID=UPI0030EC783C|tara:strand:- start:33 stop:383 length:351 start_codon:yes stop_codon:yes gene_type:complete
MLTSVIPKLPFIDKQKTINFYAKLGFSMLSDYGDYLLLKSNKVELHFFSFPTLIPEKSDFMIYLRVDSEIEKYYKKVQDLEVKIHPNGKLETKPWKQKEFAIVDPNGTLLTFGQIL